MLKILLVEDTRQHLRDAIEASREFGNIELVWATTGVEAEKKMVGYDEHMVRVPLVDGVVTDVFMPLMTVDHRPEMNHAESPVGVGVALLAHRVGIPVVFCTAGWHHGKGCAWIHHFFNDLPPTQPNDVSIPMIDSSFQYESEADTKDWKQAFETVLDIINKKSSTTSSAVGQE